MNFCNLMEQVDAIAVHGSAEITGVAHSSQEVQPGNVFVAIKGIKVDGHDFIPQALALGATAVVISSPVDLPNTIAWALVRDGRVALSQVANAFYSSPSKKLRMIGVTGTNGKTTTAFLIRSILRIKGLKTGLMGTVQNEIGDTVLPQQFTTPDAHHLQGLLRRMADENISHAVMEVSSHSLAQHRVDDVEFDTAVFTNLTQDHLDLHGTMEEYFAAKALLFTRLDLRASKSSKTAVVNVDDPWGQKLMAISGGRVLSYGIDRDADIYATDIRSSARGSTFTLCTPLGIIETTISTPGKHSIYNALAAAGAAIAEGCSLETIVEGLRLSGVPGRMEPVVEGQGFAVLVDYAHSPDAIENVLRAVRGFAQGKVIVVFGCGGDRDRGKRPLMGAAAASSDIAVLTSDNPRSEDPLRIIEDTLPGYYAVKPDGRIIVEPDRRRAIQRAIAEADADDVVLITGKGHEDYQIFREGRVHFDDREEARYAIRERMQ